MWATLTLQQIAHKILGFVIIGMCNIGSYVNPLTV